MPKVLDPNESYTFSRMFATASSTAGFGVCHADNYGDFTGRSKDNAVLNMGDAIAHNLIRATQVL